MPAFQCIEFIEPWRNCEPGDLSPNCHPGISRAGGPFEPCRFDVARCPPVCPLPARAIARTEAPKRTHPQGPRRPSRLIAATLRTSGLGGLGEAGAGGVQRRQGDPAAHPGSGPRTVRAAYGWHPSVWRFTASRDSHRSERILNGPDRSNCGIFAVDGATDQ